MADNSPSPLPESFPSEEALEEFMTAPSAELVKDLARLEGDILILGLTAAVGEVLKGACERTIGQKGRNDWNQFLYRS